MNEKRFSLTSRTVIGVILLLVGALFLLDNFEWLQAERILRFWPVLLVLFGGIKALQPGGNDGRIIGGTVAVIGLFMLLQRLHLLHVNFWAFWPLLLVAAGAAIIFRSRPGSRELADADSSDIVTGTAILGGLEQRATSKNFRGGSVSAVLGGHEVDLRDAEMPENASAVLEVFAFMGGVEVRIPRGWKVLLEATALLGGIENKTVGPDNGNRQLIIRGQAIMGGVELRN